HVRRRPGRDPGPVRPLPSAAVRVRGPRPAAGDPGGDPAAVGDAPAGLRAGAPHQVIAVRPLRVVQMTGSEGPYDFWNLRKESKPWPWTPSPSSAPSGTAASSATSRSTGSS